MVISLLRAWLQLVRFPNVFTVIADVAAAFLLVSHGPHPVGRFVCVVLAGVSLYWAGMILNDVFDVTRDQEERPSRPIPAGHIPVQQATIAGWTLLLLGVALATTSGYLPNETDTVTWLPALISVGLAIMIVAYDGPLKKTRLAPAAMGSCRVLSFLLGASPMFIAPAFSLAGFPWFPHEVLAIAFGFGIYIMGITTMARQEASGGPSSTLPIGLFVTLFGAAVLAFAPQVGGNLARWHVSPSQVFPIMVGMIAFPVILRGIRAVNDPTPTKIQSTIRVGILTIIPLAACFAFLGAGPVAGLMVFALVVPSMALAIRFRVT